MLHEINGRRLRRVRETKFMTREELHAKSGVSQSLISKLEAPHYQYGGVRLHTVKALAKALGVEPDAFVSQVLIESGDRQAS